MNKILYISGDGIADPKNKWNMYSNYFDFYSKNYFIVKALKSLDNKCEIINFFLQIWFLRLILKLESLGMYGSTRIRLKVVNIINIFMQNIIYRKIYDNYYDLIIFSDNLFFLDKKFLKKIKQITSIKVVLLSGVSPKYLLHQSEKDCAQYFDLIFISDPGHETEWKDLGAQSVICLPLSAGCPNTFQRIAKNYIKRKKYDIVFIGRLDTDAYENRIKILNYLLSKGVEVKIWTRSISKKFIEKYPLLNAQVVGSVYGEEMVKILAQSKIVLNIHGKSVPYGGNIRLFEIPATKSFQIADKCPKDWFINGDEIILFKDNQDLLDKVSYYLHDDKERLRIAHNGYKRLLKEHTYEHRMKNVLQIVQG